MSTISTPYCIYTKTTSGTYMCSYCGNEIEYNKLVYKGYYSIGCKDKYEWRTTVLKHCPNCGCNIANRMSLLNQYKGDNDG